MRLTVLFLANNHETSMEKYLVSQFNQYNEKFMNRIHKGFGLVGRDQWFPN
ncbi:hypothetical protein [Catenibacterium faecis]|uniref:Uncharacterized protein n=1 Tax=Catenibacterium faecis TaxID=2764323 RepID=A0ABR7KET5_9FIRM|nr:hypothetical protein [Catenibacterium faecis]MBC6011094.1 hypothetical protein [Catenibacterium faecis]